MARPNILFLITDQQSWHMMSCAGNRHLSTPAMDWLAARGTRFDLAFAANPVCSPSRFSLFTGRYASEARQRDNYPVREAFTPRMAQTGLGHTVRAAGYEVAYAGKEHIGSTDAAELGFQYICHDERDELASTCAAYIAQPHDTPFFLVASFVNPHDICYMALREHAITPNERSIMERSPNEMRVLSEALATAKDIPEAAFWSEKCPPLPANHQPQADEPEAIDILLDQRPFRRHARETWDETKWRMHRWAYHRLTERVDAQIGTVLQALRDHGMEDDTVVIFASDHGDHDASHKLEHKTALYEEATRVPLIVCDPAHAAPAVDTGHVACIGTDLYPTICDYAGADVPEELTGTSLRPLVGGPGPAGYGWRDSVVIESEFGFGVRTATLFYVRYDRGRSREQLYDLVRDPGQTRNFITEPAYGDDLARLRATLDDHLHQPSFRADVHAADHA